MMPIMPAFYAQSRWPCSGERDHERASEGAGERGELRAVRAVAVRAPHDDAVQHGRDLGAQRRVGRAVGRRIPGATEPADRHAGDTPARWMRHAQQRAIAVQRVARRASRALWCRFVGARDRGAR
jgi:hypothetical protein